MVRLVFVCLLALLAGCERSDPDTLVFAVATAPSVLDPRLAGDAASERINALLYDRLVRLDRQGRPQPGMANWKRLSPRHYRVTLLPDRAAFWNGSLPGPDDVIGTYSSVLDGRRGSPHAGALAHIASITAAGEDAVDFHLSRPDPTFPSRLTLGIVPASAAGSTELARQPHGSGSFEFVSWRDDGGLLLRRRGDAQLVAIAPVADPTMRVLKLLRGEAQLLQNDLPAELYAYLMAQPDIQVARSPGTTFAYLGFNLGDPVLANRDVRAAIAHAIDRQAIIRHLFGGLAEEAGAILRPDHWAGAPALRGFAYDPSLSRRYLARAGYNRERPLELSYKTSTDPFRLRIAHVFQHQMAAVGIRLKISSYDWGTFFGDIKAGRFQLYSLAWVGVNTPDILRYAFHSQSRPPGGANRGRYDSERFDRLIDAAEQAQEAAAQGLYVAAQQLIHDDIVYVPLWYEANVAASHDAAGYTPGHDGNYLALNTMRHADATRP